MMSYWRDRELEHMQSSILSDRDRARRLQQIQMSSLQEIQRQIDAFIARYSDAEGISKVEARKRISRLDIEEYERKVRRYVSTRDFSDRATRELRLYNVTMQTNRLELLKANIWLDMVAAGNETEQLMMEELIADTLKEFERQSGILGMTVGDTSIKARAIVDQSFLSNTWSNRLWANQEGLRRELDSLLQRAIMQGVHSNVLARHLQERFSVNAYTARRLLITEKARVETEAQKISYEEFGYDSYEFVAEPGACEVCRELDGKVFKVNDMQPGENAAPMHPFCKCSTSPNFDRAAFEADLAARGL